MGHWHGCGTAWYLAEQGHAVTLVTPYPMAGMGLQRMAADWPLRQRVKKLGIEVICDAALGAWHGDGADVIDLRDGSERRLDADSLVLATLNHSQTWLYDDLTGGDLELHAIGDCVAPRLANMAIYEGRKLGLTL